MIISVVILVIYIKNLNKMKTSLLLTVLTTIIVTLNSDAQNKINLNPEYISWVYSDTNHIYSATPEIIYTAEDSGIAFSSLKQKDIYSENKINLQYINAKSIDEIEV